MNEKEICVNCSLEAIYSIDGETFCKSCALYQVEEYKKDGYTMEDIESVTSRVSGDIWDSQALQDHMQEKGLGFIFVNGMLRANKNV